MLRSATSLLVAISAVLAEQAGFVTPQEVNVRIEADPRLIITMAAVNMAGFNYEPGGLPLGQARAELRRDLADLDPSIKKKLADFYNANRRAGVEEAADALRYAALSLWMSEPPGLVISGQREKIPEDLKPLIPFADLAREFYLNSRFKQLLPKYLAMASEQAAAYHRPVGELIYALMDYFHIKPDTIIHMKPLVIEGDRGKKAEPTLVARSRARQVFILVDPFSAAGASFVRDDLLNQKYELLARRLGDDYTVVLGPSRSPNLEAIGRALIRFFIDPMIERHLRKALEYKDQITKLVASIPSADKEFGSSVYLVARESLAAAAEARLKRLGRLSGRGNYAEEDAMRDLARAYQRGAALAFHFYEQLIGLEKVGISIEDVFDQMLETIKFDREAERPKQFEGILARAIAPARDPQPSALTEKILLADELIRQRRFEEARAQLDEVLALDPNNARALYGMARVINQTPSPVELDPNADENDKIQAQYDRLNRAISLYRKAIEKAAPEQERWLIQWSHVLIGRIYDFLEFRADAIAEYEKALALGDVPNGAYREALEGKNKPYSKKPN